MLEAAADLEFEEAARLRNVIDKLVNAEKKTGMAKSP